DREAQHGRGREEREQLADAELARRREPHAAEEAQRERDIRHEQEPEPDARDRPRLLHLGAAQALRLPGELLERELAATERLEHADAVHALLDRGREIAL